MSRGHDSHLGEGSLGEGSLGDSVLDEIFGGEVDWRELVARYPKVSLALAAGGGLVLGLRHGPALLAAFSDALGERAATAIRAVADSSGFEDDEYSSDEEYEDEDSVEDDFER